MSILSITYDTIDGGLNELGVQLEEPMSNDVGRSLYHKPFGFIEDSAKQATRDGGG